MRGTHGPHAGSPRRHDRDLEPALLNDDVTGWGHVGDARTATKVKRVAYNTTKDTVAATFMGMTYGCARCHDHKFDPILQKDYYRLQAFFANATADDAEPRAAAASA